MGNVLSNLNEIRISVMNFVKKISKYFKLTGLPYKVSLPYTHVVQIGDPALRSQAYRVNKTDINTVQIQKVINILKTILINDSLTGISACQIGMPLSIIVFQVPKCVLPENIAEFKIESLPPQVWINPSMKILDYSTSTMHEMCSSVVGLSAEVKRYKKISISGLDENGNIQSLEASDFLARIIQHEMDHLNGVVFTDLMNPKSLKNVLWNEINELNGFVELTYYPKA